jgi:hypothetical protein
MEENLIEFKFRGFSVAAVISGLGLGLFNSAMSNGVGAFGQASHGQAKEEIYVNAATGNLVVQNTDEKVTGLGLGFSILRTYNPLGKSRSHPQK